MSMGSTTISQQASENRMSITTASETSSDVVGPFNFGRIVFALLCISTMLAGIGADAHVSNAPVFDTAFRVLLTVGFVWGLILVMIEWCREEARESP